MTLRLLAKLQSEVEARLGESSSPAFASCLKGGTWVAPYLFPKLELDYHPHTDGFQAVSVIGVSKTAVGLAARSLAESRSRAGGDKVAEWSRVAKTPWIMMPTAYEDMLERHRLLSRVTEDLAIAALCLIDQPSELKVAPDLVASAISIANRAEAFREYLGCRILQGNSPSANLGATIPAIEFQLVWQGKLAAGLPVRPMLSGLNGEMARASDSYGMVRIDFTAPANYTGSPINAVGFELDWDALALGAGTGLRTEPWTTAVTLPSVENTLVYVSLVEKVRDRPVEGPIRAGILALLKQAGIAHTTELPSADESRFVMEISGVVACDDLDESRGTSVRQIRGKGSVVLQAHKGNLLKSIQDVQGLGTWVSDDSMNIIPDPPKPARDAATPPKSKAERDAEMKAEADRKKANEEARKKREEAIDRGGQQALEDAWAVWRPTIVREFRQVFPPLFRMDAEK